MTTLSDVVAQLTNDADEASHADLFRKEPNPPSSEMLALVLAILRSGSLRLAMQTAAENTRRWVGCERSIFCLPSNGNSPGEMTISGSASPHENSDLGTQIDLVTTELIERKLTLSWPLASSEQMPPSLLLKSLAELLGSRAILAIPLQDLEGSVAGAWILAGDTRLSQQEDLWPTLRAISRPVSDALLLVQQAEPSWLQTRWIAITNFLGSQAAWVTGGAIALIAAVLSFVSISYQVECKAWIEPSSERVVSAPIDGILERSFVKPGDEVHAGQQLARMDDKNGLALVSTLEARLDQNRKRRETALARRHAGEAQIAALDARQAEQELEVARRRQSKLVIESPIDGIVLAGDLHCAEGMPLKVGQTLFQIAPKSSCIIALAVPERESLMVSAGQNAKAVFDAAPGVYFSGALDRVHPRAELRDEQNVFIAEMKAEDGIDQLRPGMRGRAKIQTEYCSLGWILFHRPWQAMLDSWPW